MPPADSSSANTNGSAVDVAQLAKQELSWDAMQHALSCINEGIAVADPSLPDAPMVYVNEAFLRLTGYTREECIGKNCRFLQGPGTDPVALERLRRALAERRDVQVELLNYRKGGEPFWNLLSITHVWDKSGGGDGGSGSGDGSGSGSDGRGSGSNKPPPRYLIGVQSDVTDLARKAQAAQAARNRFIANMSHELRTPLNGILATAQLLLTSPLSPEQRELADTILDSSMALLGTLGDILDFSLLEAAPEVRAADGGEGGARDRGREGKRGRA
jgi:PAS domain S-box-containing protein